MKAWHTIRMPVKDDMINVWLKCAYFRTQVFHSCEPWTQLWTPYLESHHCSMFMLKVECKTRMPWILTFEQHLYFVLVNYAHFRTKNFVENNLVNKVPKKTLSATLMILCILFGCKLMTWSILNKLWLWFIVPFRWGMARAYVVFYKRGF